MVDHSEVKLGKAPPRRDSRTLQMARYTVLLPEPPDNVDWTGRLGALGMMLNDQLGDCTCAAIGHVIQTWTSLTGKEVVLSDDDILALYEKACGYNPSDPSTDQGGVELDVLNYWHKNPVEGHDLAAFCEIQPQDSVNIRHGVWMFGAIYIGLALPISAQRQDTWDVSPGSDAEYGSWGGHAVPIVAYDAYGLTCITWGQLKTMTWDFLNTYCDEAYALFGPDWLADNQAPSGFDMDSLQADLSSL